MSKIIDYYASLSSPWTYLGHRRLCDLAEKYNATVQFKPVNFGAVFSATGGLPLAKRAPERQKYRFMELKRWSKELDLPLNLEPKHFPVDPLITSLMCIALMDKGESALNLAEKILQAVWAGELDISDKSVLIKITNTLGLDGESLIEQSSDPKYAALYNLYGEEAIKQGVFGAPSFVIEDEIFWGQDRLNFVEKKLQEGA